MGDWKGQAPRLAAALAAIILMLFVALNLALVVNRGVCCADDAYFATVAKNLARGFGYSSSLGYIDPSFALKPFDIHIGAGPAFIVPTSAAIRILGNRAWVPGVVQVTLWTALLITVWRSLGPPVASRGRASIVIAVFLLVVYAMSVYHLEQWYAMLGEVPAALVILLGLTIWAVDPASIGRSLLAAMLCSLAVLIKLLALLYAATFVVAAVIVVGASSRRDPRHLWKLVAVLLLGFVLPIIAAEMWKVSALGLSGYGAHLRALGEHLRSQGVGRASLSTGEIATKLDAFSASFGVSLMGFLILAGIGAILAWCQASAPFKRLYAALLAGITVHACYWLVISVDWPRYFFIGVILLGAMVSIPYLVLARPTPALLYSGALAVSLFGTIDRLPGPIDTLGSTWFVPSVARSNQERVVKFLDDRPERRPFVAQWWASVADLEYLTNGVADFKGYQALTPDEFSRGVLLVTNQRFDHPGDTRFAALVASCDQAVLAAAPYAIHTCGGPNAMLPAWTPTSEASAGKAPVKPTSITPPDAQGPSAVATDSCNLERVGGWAGSTSPVTMGRGATLWLDGWVVNDDERRAPERPYLALQSVDSRKTWYAALTMGHPREDVGRARRHDGYHASGFSALIDTAVLPPDEYRLVLVFRDSGPLFTCDNGRRVVLR